ncbi:Fic family protein [Rhodohalobacter sp. 614A]|uniref:Fic family protein n=1 Tax=Rhodohalobacter sp. 614A TaxID=2908649 RepID=UPI001F452CAF|nr:Fic/DOC family N-terminal domain-containing protein [Rhodohalobacter sp. 614A]
MSIKLIYFDTYFQYIEIIDMSYHPEKPYNLLSPLPPEVELESPAVLKAAIAANRTLAELKGKSESLPNPSILVNSIVLQEAKASSEIENVVTTNDKLFTALSANDSTVDPQTKEVLRYRQALWKGIHYLENHSLNTDLFIELMQIIKETDAGIRSEPGTVIANPNTRKIIYWPPEGGALIRNLLVNLEAYIYEKDDTDPLIKMAVIHYQFEAIHPFDVGNGRTGRLLNILYLIKMNLLHHPTLYLSEAIIRQKSEYYRRLRAVTEEADWESWILFILEAVKETSDQTMKRINQILTLLNETVESAKNQLPDRVYSKELIELLFEQPYCKVKFLVDRGIAKRQTAADYLRELENIGILKSKQVGRENLFLNTRLYELLTHTE